MFLKHKSNGSKFYENNLSTFKKIRRHFQCFFDNTDDSFISTATSGSAQNNLSNTLHTAAIYLTSYCGTVSIEATLDETVPTNPNSWYTVTTLPFVNPTTGIQYVNFDVNVNWVRFRHLPDLLNLGTVDKILYRP